MRFARLLLMGLLFLYAGLGFTQLGTTRAVPCHIINNEFPYPFEYWDVLSGWTPEIDTDQSGSIDIRDMIDFGFRPFRLDSLCAGIEKDHHMAGDYLAPGMAWGDYDGDGFADLYLTDTNGPNTLFRNLGNGNFEVSALNAQVALAGVSSGGALFVDLDDDGWQDIYVLNRGPNAFFRNLGGTGFVESSELAGIDDDKQGQSAAAGDFNGDGFLDLYVVNWGELGSRDDVLYRNNGDGTFSDVSFLLTNPGGPGFAVSFLDFDNDGDLDIYVVNDKLWKNVLMRNDGSGCGEWCFTDVSASSGADTSVDGMGLSVSDYDGDGDLDLYFSNAGPMFLLQNQTAQGSPTFIDVAQAEGVDFPSIGWGSFFFDYNNDGLQDLYLATMDAEPELSNRLFQNRQGQPFLDVTSNSGAANNGPSIGVTFADVEQDGSLDLIVGNMGAGYYFYRNQRAHSIGNNWITIKLVGGNGINKDAIGARVYVVTSGARTLFQELKAGSSIGSNNEKILHFGLGLETISNLEVKWPNGVLSTLGVVSHNNRLVITYIPPK